MPLPVIYDTLIDMHRECVFIDVNQYSRASSRNIVVCHHRAQKRVLSVFVV